MRRGQRKGHFSGDGPRYGDETVTLWNERRGLIPRNPKKRNGGRYRIRTYDFHRVNLHIFNLFNSLHDTGRNTKSLEIQVRPNRALLTVHE